MSRDPYEYTARRIEQALAYTRSPIPLLPEDSIKALEALFPPRCITPHEDIRDHERYAGRVELIALLRARFEAAPKDRDNPTEEPEAEHARSA